MKIRVDVVGEDESTIFGNEVLEIEDCDLLTGISITIKEDSTTSVILEYNVDSFLITAEDFINTLLKFNKSGQISRINKNIIEKGSK